MKAREITLRQAQETFDILKYVFVDQANLVATDSVTFSTSKACAFLDASATVVHSRSKRRILA